jgi:hypothetical protein
MPELVCCEPATSFSFAECQAKDKLRSRKGTALHTQFHDL